MKFIFSKHSFFTLLLSFGLTAASATASLAAEDRTPIDEVELSFSADFQIGETGGQVEVSLENGDCSIDYWEVANDKLAWSSGSRPEIRVYLTADDGYYFKTSGKSLFRLEGEGASYLSASPGDEKSSLTLTVRLRALEGDDDENEITGVEWDGNSGAGRWDAYDGARYYQVKLLLNSNEISSILNTGENTYDFSKMMSDNGSYTFQVRAVDDEGGRTPWVQSPALGSNSSSRSPGSWGAGTWKQDGIGWWYEYADGIYPKNCWQMINGLWYYFGEEGYMRTGWIEWQNQWYYCDLVTGAMLSSAATPDGYLVDEHGIWVNR